MAIPDYQAFMLPLLKYASDSQEHSLNDAIEYLCKEFGITEEERRQLLPSGLQFVVYNRIAWARTYLSKAGLLEQTRRGFLRLLREV